jgi:DNA-binding PadR family transcriptional regulator
MIERPLDWRHGYDLSKAAGLSSGTLYPLLVRLHDRGVLEAEWRAPEQPGRPARHVYRLTRAGLDLARSLEDAARLAPPLKEALA